MQHSFLNVNQDDIFKCMMFYNYASLKSREDMQTDFMKLVQGSEEVAMTVPVNCTYL
jgi:hypothetical protein